MTGLFPCNCNDCNVVRSIVLRSVNLYLNLALGEE